MSATRISGAETSRQIRERLSKAVRKLPAQPTLAVILVGDDPASAVYVKSKVRKTEEIGMRSVQRVLPANCAQTELEATISAQNEDPNIDGILLQLPLPAGLDSSSAIECIDPNKDVDGLTEVSAGRLSLGKAGLRPCTPSGCVILAKQALGEDLSGLNVTVVGRSILVGKPAAQLFTAENCTVTLAHSRTRDLGQVCHTADILVAAIGKPEFVKSNWIKPGACVIDVGINRVPAPERGSGKTKLVGDVDFDPACAVAGSITPVPGGVGPMTIACLLQNTVIAACRRRGWPMPDGGME
nr:bifunctional methylenetetrahydrofolate dehydrogenase/methenyltetrahydrofolate cyclohydrolase FolD [Hyphomonas sp. Mor2]